MRQTRPMTRVIVVGAGVIGLTCAIRLLESGRRVDVVARDLPLETASAVAAAIWYPYRALPQDRVTEWAGSSYAEFMGLAHDPETGVQMRTGTEVFRARSGTRGGGPRCPASIVRLRCPRGTSTAGRSSPR